MRARSATGQAIVEYVGVLLLVAVLVLSAVNAGVGPWLVSTVKAAACHMQGGRCAAAPARARQTYGGLDPGAPHSGPAIGGGSVLGALPFPGRPGSISIGGDRPIGGLDVDGTPTDSPVKAKLRITTERSECTEDAQGHPQVTLGATADLSVEAGGQLGDGDAKEGGSIFAGGDVSYQIKTDPEHADRIAAGGERPNPRDPRSIPTNSSLVLNRDTYKGAKGSLAYHEITAELGYKDGHQVSAGVKRLDAARVQIMVGDSKLVENSLSLRIGPDEANVGLSLSRGMSDGKLRAVDLDISTPEGWDAYQSFIETGRLPADGAPGTADPTTSDVLSFTSTDQVGAKLGPLEARLGGSHLDGQAIEVRRPDGTRTDTVIDNRGSTQLVETYDRDPDGSISNETYSIRLQDPDPSEVDGYDQFGGASGPTHGRDITFTYTPAELQTMQDAALDQILAAQRDSGNGRFPHYTRSRLRAWLRDHPYGDGLAPAGGPLDDTILTAMARGDAPATAVALYNSGQGDSSALLEFLIRFSQDTKLARHRLGLAAGQGTLGVGSVANTKAGC